MYPIVVYSWLFASLPYFAAAQVQELNDVPSCAYSCTNLLALPAVSNCTQMSSGAIRCLCSNSEVVSQLAQCGTEECPPEVVAGFYPKLVSICKEVGVVIPATVTLTSTTLVLPNATSTSSIGEETTKAVDATSTSATGAASTSSGGTAGGRSVQGTTILKWASGVMATYYGLW